MNTKVKVFLLLGAAAIFVGSGLALAQDAPPPDGMHGPGHHGGPWALMELMHKNGKITHADFDQMLADRFAKLSGGKDAITADQFSSMHEEGPAKFASEMFKRLDWNGDGRVSLEEFKTAEHGRFLMMDRDGSGTISCDQDKKGEHRMGMMPAEADANMAPPPPPGDQAGPPPPDGHGPRMGRWMHRGVAMRDHRFCAENDLDKDGKVTRAEFDKAIVKRFDEHSGGHGGITEEKLAADMAKHRREMGDKMFHHLDTNGDGRITLAEFSAPHEAMFARLDKNKDGVITPDELGPRFHGRHGHRHGDHDKKPEAN